MNAVPQLLSIFRWLLAATLLGLVLALCGCAGHPSKPAVPVSPATWRQVDADLEAASKTAAGKAEDYAQNAMQNWMDLVYQRTDNDFIPWFSSYWTQEWLGVRVAFYKLGAKQDDEAATRLANYLQGQYRKRVLDAVARQMDPDSIMQASTGYYLQELANQVKAMPDRYGIAQGDFDRRLQDIPAIVLGPPEARNASLFQLLQARSPQAVPAYTALLEHVRQAGKAGTSVEAPDAGMAAVAKQTSERLVGEMTVGGAASAVASAVGKVAGAMISLGSLGFSVMSRDKARPEMEVQLRNSVNAAFDEQWLKLMRDPDNGVLAGVRYLSIQVEGNLLDSEQPRVQTAPQSVPDAGEAP